MTLRIDPQPPITIVVPIEDKEIIPSYLNLGYLIAHDKPMVNRYGNMTREVVLIRASTSNFVDATTALTAALSLKSF